MATLAAQEQVPTHSLSNEMSVLGSMMVADEWAEDAYRLGLKPEHFYRPSHRTICRAIYDLRQAGKPTGIQFVATQLGRDLSEIGNDDYLVQICEYMPIGSQVEHYAREVIQHWARNELTKVAQLAQDPEIPMDEVKARMDGALQGLVAPGSKVVSPLSPPRDMQRKRGIRTYMPLIDRSTSVYGLPAGQFALVAAYTKAGKTALLRQIAVNVAKNGGRVLYGLFADLVKEELEALVMRNLTGFQHTPDSGDGFEALAEWDKAIKEIEIGWDFDVYDPQDIELEQAGHIETFAAYALREHARRPYDLVCIDYAQELTSKEVRGGDSYANGDICSRKVRALARKMKSASTIVASQVTEGGKDKRDTTKGGRHWEERSGYVLYLKRDEDDSIDAEVKYQRFGKSGIKWRWQWETKHLEYR